MGCGGSLCGSDTLLGRVMWGYGGSLIGGVWWLIMWCSGSQLGRDMWLIVGYGGSLIGGVWWLIDNVDVAVHW